MRALILRLLGDQAGTAVIELALAAPILTAMVAGVVDLTLAFNRKLVLEQAVQRSIERVMQTTMENTVEENIEEDVHDAAGDDVEVQVSFTATCTNRTDLTSVRELDVNDADAECAATEIEARYIEVQATTEYDPIIPVKALGRSRDSFTLTATAGMRTR
jgi:Flp pilus assembly protein TadG